MKHISTFTNRNHLSLLLSAIIASAVLVLSSSGIQAQTFSSTPGVTIPDDGYNGSPGSMATDDILVSGLTGVTTDIVVELGLDHTWMGDLVVKLVSPEVIRLPLCRGSATWNWLMTEQAAVVRERILYPRHQL